MNEKPVTNRPTMKKILSVPRVQIPELVKQATVANIALAADKVRADIINLAENIKSVADKTFVMMKNKKVWFDRNNAALYPKFEEFTLPEFKTAGQPSKNYSVDFEGFHFVGMTRREGLNSFINGSGNPYLKDDGNFRNFPNSQNRFGGILTGELNSGGVWVVWQDGCLSNYNNSDIFTLVPIYRLKGNDSGHISFLEAVWLWLKNELIPEGLNSDDEQEYLRILREYKNFFAYLEFADDGILLAEKINDDLSKLIAEMKSFANKTFVMMKNKQVWFDRNNAALYPKFEKFSLPKFRFYDKSAKNYNTEFEGFNFVGMTRRETLNSFVNISGNPYLQDDGNFRTFSANYNNLIFTCETSSDDYTIYIHSYGAYSWWNDSRYATLVPICRFKGKNSGRVGFVEAVLLWLKNGLVPEGLSAEVEKKYTDFMSRPDFQSTIKNICEEFSRIKCSASAISFSDDNFKSDVLGGKFTDKISGFDFNISLMTEKILKGEEKLTASPELLKQELLNCDHKRANIQPYEERQITDVNRGHWELFEDAASDTVQVQLPQNEMLVARPPQLDVRLNGICSIDFGTKSTIVVCLDGDARMLRIGRGDYSQAPTMRDFENPTVIELRDIQSFLKAYRARGGRPFTEWNQVTVSHQAAEAIFKDNANSSVYNSVFHELKQWAKDEQSYPVLKDLRGVIQEIKPYLETREIDAGDFDPIELYAYYLGLYINNMHHQIYLDYILSFPVNYKKDIREHIRQSFESGIRKSLPPALQRDGEYMKRFRVYLGASEPAAYAISALEGFGLEPKEFGEKVAYGVFDFGGGTTDFDFGIEYVPENRRKCNFIIEQFGFNGDVLLGGENILELLAYEVYKDNLDKMREKKIPFALPSGCEIFAGAETLVSRTKDASSHMNNRTLAEKLRPIWENTDDRKNLTDAPLNVILFSNEKKEGGNFTVNVSLDINGEKLDKCIEDRIREGVVNFFQSLYSAFKGREVYPIHIFLAGNSCRSPIVKKLFDEFIKREEEKLANNVKMTTGQDKDASGTFILHMPLGMTEDKAEGENPPEQKFNIDLDKQRTGKTGVAFGLLRCRKGGKDVKIINENLSDGGEVIFPYFLGDAGNDGKTFTVRIGRNVGYNEWAYFTVADEPEFELYYTTAPRALQGKMTTAQVKMIHCLLDDEDIVDDDKFGVYIRKVSPNQIEYAVGCKEDFEEEFNGKTYKQTL